MKLMIVAAMLSGVQPEMAPPPCLTHAEFKDLALFVLPAALEGAATRCAASLPSGAYLLTRGRSLGVRLAGEGEARRQGAAAAFAKLGGGKLPEGLSSDTLTSLARDMVKSELFKKVSPNDCATINEVAELLAPLPPENLAGAVGLIARTATEKQSKASFRFCPAELR